jgi:hypothetical protein
MGSRRRVGRLTRQLSRRPWGRRSSGQPFFWVLSIVSPFSIWIGYTIIMTAATSCRGDDDDY